MHSTLTHHTFVACTCLVQWPVVNLAGIMAEPSELSLEKIREFMLQKGGKVTNHDLVKHFKPFLTDPLTKGLCTLVKYPIFVVIMTHQTHDITCCICLYCLV